MATIEEVRERFKNDRFATQAAGVEVILTEDKHAICEMPIKDVHLNANDVPMGGAIFTLADFTFAIAANGQSKDITVAQQVSITFLAAAKGEKLTAEAKCIKAGRRTSLYEVNVFDDIGVHVAHVTGNGFTVGEFVKS